MPLNAYFLSRGQARRRDLHSCCRIRRIGYIAPANSDTGKGHLYNLHSKNGHKSSSQIFVSAGNSKQIM